MNARDTLVLEATYVVAAYKYEGGVIPINQHVQQLYAFFGTQATGVSRSLRFGVQVCGAGIPTRWQTAIAAVNVRGRRRQLVLV